MSGNTLGAFAESTLVSAVKHVETARSLAADAATCPTLLIEVLAELARAQQKVRHVLALVEDERRLAARLAPTEPPPSGESPAGPRCTHGYHPKCCKACGEDSYEPVSTESP